MVSARPSPRQRLCAANASLNTSRVLIVSAPAHCVSSRRRRRRRRSPPRTSPLPRPSESTRSWALPRSTGAPAPLSTVPYDWRGAACRIMPTGTRLQKRLLRDGAPGALALELTSRRGHTLWSTAHYSRSPLAVLRDVVRARPQNTRLRTFECPDNLKPRVRHRSPRPPTPAAAGAASDGGAVVVTARAIPQARIEAQKPRDAGSCAGISAFARPLNSARPADRPPPSPAVE